MNHMNQSDAYMQTVNLQGRTESTIRYTCYCCRRITVERASTVYTVTIPSPPWHCERPECQEQKARGTVMAWAIRPFGGARSLHVERFDEIEQHVAAGGLDVAWEIRRVEMSREEWEARPKRVGGA